MAAPAGAAPTASAASSSPSSQQGVPRPRPASSEFDPSTIQEMRESKQELIVKVQSMKKDLTAWRSRMNQQVESYRAELTGLQASLTSEMGSLRGELADMKARIRQQLDQNVNAVTGLRQQHAGDLGTEAALAAAGPTRPQQTAAASVPT